ncbi:MAG: hypothetical protein PGN22_02570 [Agrobacterium cavarae]
MPFDSNGNYTLPTSYFVQNGDTVLPIQHNPPFEDVAQALSSVLPRSGVAPMNGDLKMGGKKVIGMADGAASTDAVTKGQLDTVSDTANKKANKAGDTFTGDMLFGPGTGGRYSKLQANGDVQLNRGDNTGFNTWNAPNAYFGWDGGRYVFGPAGGLVAYGYLQVDGPGLSTKFKPSGDIDFSGFMNTEFGPYLSTVLRGFKSGNQPYVTNGSGSVAHGLGRKPSKLSSYFVCTTAIYGWSVGDEFEVAPHAWSNQADYGITLWADTTNIFWKFPRNGLAIIGKSDGVVYAAPAANFSLRVRGAL